MGEVTLKRPTNIFALADGDLFASILEVERVTIDRKCLKLFLKAMPKPIPPPNWLDGVVCSIVDSVSEYDEDTTIDCLVEEDGRAWMRTMPITEIPMTHGFAMGLSVKTTLVLFSPYGKAHTLNFHSLLRAEHKSSSKG
jgi:hypothetical protein